MLSSTSWTRSQASSAAARVAFVRALRRSSTLCYEAGEDPALLRLGGRGLAQAMRPAGQRVDAGVDDHLERVAPLSDEASRASSGGRRSLGRHAPSGLDDTLDDRAVRGTATEGQKAWSEQLPRLDSNQ